MKKKSLLLYFSAILLSSCGVKFSPITHNKTTPEDLKNRTFWDQTDIFKYNLEQLTGSILYKVEGEGNFRRGSRVVDEANKPSIEAIENGLLYHSKINREYEGGVSVLSFTTELSTDQMVDVKITDIFQSFIEFESIPIDRIKEIIDSDELANTKKYYIQGALLTSVTKTYGSEISANASGVVGGAFKAANGKIYNEETDFIQDYKISLALIDLDKLDILLEASPLVDDRDELINMIKSSISKVDINSIDGF